MDTPTHTAIARHLKLKPNAAEKKLGYTSGASLVESVVDAGEAWRVITARGSKHDIAKAALK